MIDKYITKQTVDSMDIGIIHFIDEKKVKVGSKKDSWRDVDYICNQLAEAQGKRAKVNGCKVIGTVNYTKVVERISVAAFDQTINKLKSMGHIVQSVKKLERTMR